MARTGVNLWVVAAGLGGFLVAAGCKKPPPPIPPTTVLVAPAVEQDLSITAEYVGTIEGYVNAEIRARVRGFLKSQDYSDGAFVKTGQLLFTIDPSEFQTAVAQAKGALARAQAAYGQAKVTAERYKPLAAKQAVSQQELDDAVAAQRAAAATVDSAKAALDEAQLSLGYTRITSPVDGVAGTALVRVGNLVGQGEPTLLTTVSQLDPMRVTFPISEATYFRVAERAAQIIKLDPLDAGTERRILDLILADGTVYRHKGWFVALNREVEKGTGTIQVQTLFPNAERILRPGAYGRVRVPRQNEGKGMVVIPETAVKELQGSFTVAVLTPEDTVQIRSVEVGPRAAKLWAITKGLKAGERVITEGAQKVSEGQKVNPQPDPAVAPKTAAGAPPDAGG
jgi:membrane fusion protein, multidrug efflux system